MTDFPPKYHQTSQFPRKFSSTTIERNFDLLLYVANKPKWCFIFLPGRTKCTCPKKLPDKIIPFWNLHKKFQFPSAMGLREYDFQNHQIKMGVSPLIEVHWFGV